MRRFACLPLAPRCTAAVTALRLQSHSSRPYGRGSFSHGRGGGGGDRGSYNSNSSSGGSAGGGPSDNLQRPPVPNAIMNKTHDGELSFETRVAMRDDSIILSEVFQHLPPQGAISLKSLFSALNADVQEALSEQHGGLRRFIEERKQIFTVRPSPKDGVLYVVGNPIVAQQYATRTAQLKTMRAMLGLSESGGAVAEQPRRPGGSFGNRGGRGGYNNSNNGNRGRGSGGGDRHDGSGQRRYSNNNSNYNNNDSRGGGGEGSYAPRGGYRGGGGGGSQGNRSRAIGSQPRSFGNRN